MNTNDDLKTAPTATSAAAPTPIPSIAPELLLDFAQTVWTTVLGAELTPATGVGPAGEFTGSVAITGAWEGSVTIECSATFAKWAASRMFDMPVTTPEEIRDALGELTNMVGGNLKAMLPGPSRLSLPRVAEHSSGAPEPPTVGLLQLNCGGEAIVLRLVPNQNSTSEKGQ